MKLIFLMLFFWGYAASTYSQADEVTIDTKTNGITLQVNGQDFMINGMNWDYYPIGTNYTYSLWDKKDSLIMEALDREMSLLKNMGVNAIRVYTGIPKKWVEYIYTNYGIYTMLNHLFGRYGLTIKGEWVAQTDYADADTRQLILNEVKQLAEQYKDTKGLLMFLLGNENNYGLVWEGAETENIPAEDNTTRQRIRSLYTLFNEAAVAMKAIDPAHPVALCNGDLQYLDLIARECKDVDILGTNVYRGISFGDVFERVKKEYGKPVLFTEFGADAFDAVAQKEDQNSQAAYLSGNWREIYGNAAGLGESGNCIGGFTFQWSDGWWKFAQTQNLDIHDTNASWSNGGYKTDFAEGQNNMNEEWFGVCAKGAPNANGLFSLIPRTAYYVLKQVHQFNAYADSATLTGLNLYFDRINETTGQVATKEITAKDILGNPEYRAICYSGFRAKTRSIQPTLEQVMEDLRILSAMNIKVIRTYDVHYEISTVLEAIRALKSQDADFEMYVMLGAWINCKDAFSALPPDHTQESEQNAIEIAEAVRLANAYPDIIKMIAVGNEAMVKWAASYYVQPDIILKWVNHLQNLKKENKLPANIWITSSDNFASWGGGGNEYHIEALTQLMKAVDYISMHTYPMHDTHYNPDFWGLLESEAQLTDREKIQAAMIRARDYAIGQYYSVLTYMKSVGVEKQIHIGETGWATMANERYGTAGSKATDEYKSALYYNLMREWTNSEGLSLFYFEAFDEQWKDSANPMGSENHFGLINLQSQAKYVIWDLVDQGVFKGLTRDGMPITKTYDGDEKALWKDVQAPVRVIKMKN